MDETAFQFKKRDVDWFNAPLAGDERTGIEGGAAIPIDVKKKNTNPLNAIFFTNFTIIHYRLNSFYAFVRHGAQRHNSLYSIYVIGYICHNFSKNCENVGIQTFNELRELPAVLPQG